jgi:hypothetical protein
MHGSKFEDRENAIVESDSPLPEDEGAGAVQFYQQRRRQKKREKKQQAEQSYADVQEALRHLFAPLERRALHLDGQIRVKSDVPMEREYLARPSIRVKPRRQWRRLQDLQNLGQQAAVRPRNKEGEFAGSQRSGRLNRRHDLLAVLGGETVSAWRNFKSRQRVDPMAQKLTDPEIVQFGFFSE